MTASPSLTPADQFAIGSVLDGRYRIDAVLGTGGMGRVYRAEHTKIGKSVAIKVLHAEVGRNREASQRFQREAIASGRLDHPNIVGVSDFCVLEDGACYLVMEVLEGESLGDRLSRERRIHWVEALDILRGVLYGLRHAHERGVVHRDIKPDNVYLAHKDGDPVVKILDFGIAKLYAGSADDPASTRAGLTVGTPAYLSPEQAVGGEITPASDLYSASIVLYEMLAGRAPFEDKDPLAMLGAHVGRRPPALGEAAPGVDIPPALEAIIQHGLAKTPAARIPTATEYLARLDEFSPPLRAMPRNTDQFAVTTERPPPALATTHDATHPVADSARPARAVHAATPAPDSASRAQARQVAVVAPTPASPATVRGATPSPVEATDVPRAVHAISVAAVNEPIPLSWMIRSSFIIAVVVVAALVLSIAARCVSDPPTPSATTSSPSTAGPATAIPPVDRAAQVRTLLRELEDGKTCAERRAPIARLVELGDPRAVEALKRARVRSGPGNEGNACLRADVDGALKALATAR
jgi:eukaryotic-like serine/threonine-protein kinase